jgi:hypothetical protein
MAMTHFKVILRSVTLFASTLTLALLAAPVGRAADTSGAATQPPGASGNLAPAIELEPKALNILKGASARLAAAKTLSFRAVTSEESPSRLGPPLVYLTMSEVKLSRPDKLRVLSPGDGPSSDFYYDGKTMTAYSPQENLVAVASAPATIDAMLAAAFSKAQIYFPFADLMVADPYKGITEGLRVAFYIGQSDSVGGTKTHIVAYADDHAFVQAWIGADDRLPRRLRAVFRNDPLQLRHEVELSDWKLDRPILPEEFTPPESAKKALPIAFGDPQAMPAVDRASGTKTQ